MTGEDLDQFLRTAKHASEASERAITTLVAEVRRLEGEIRLLRAAMDDAVALLCPQPYPERGQEGT
jgi:hypothetical protein